MAHILWIIGSYLLGSVPFGLIIAKALCGQDPRLVGSQNIGATNVARVCGTWFGMATLILDLAKGLLPVLLAPLIIFPAPSWYVSLVALAAILGHVFPVYLGGKGGKAVATTIGAFLALAFWPILLAVVACLLVIWLSGFVSLGSLTLVTVFPLALLCFGRVEILPVALVVTGLVYWRHKDNIARLAKGEEKSWKKNKDKSPVDSTPPDA